MLTARVTLEPAFGLGNRRPFSVADERAFRTHVCRKATQPVAIGYYPGGDGQPRAALPTVSFSVPRLTPATKENQ